MSENEDYEPQVTSNDPNERKLARRLRIERRWAAIQKSASSPEMPTVEEQDQKNAIQQQVQKSTELLEKFINEAEEYITNVRIANDSREVDRRELEGTIKEKVFKELDAEAESAQKQFEEIAVKWSVIQKYNDPLQINEDIANQKEKCELLIKQKDGIIAMLKDELKSCERKFSIDQRKQNEDINVLSQRIEKQVSLISRAYQTELELIEEVIMSERQNLTDANNKKWEELFKKQREQETQISTKKFEQIEDYTIKMNALREDFYEKFRSTKIQLEVDIDNLQKELERIKAVALLNSEKLDYNYQILKKREDENLIIKSQQKRRLNKLHDVINDMKKKISKYETTTTNNINKLKANIKSLQKNIIDVETKADHFAKVNDEKFHQIWDLNKDTCDRLLQKILSTDKILHEQHLGIQWSAPSLNIMTKNTMSSYKSAITILNRHKIEKDQLKVSNEKVILDMVDVNSYSNYRKLLKHILKQISDKSGFLTEKRLKELLKPFEEGDQCLVKLDQIFQSIKISNPRYIDILMNFFFPYCYCPICNVNDEATNSIGSKYASQISNMASAYSRMDQHHVEITELDDALKAIQQPEEIIHEIVLEIVSSETYLDDNDVEKEEDITDTCGNMTNDSFLIDLKEKRIMKKKSTYNNNVKIICQYNHPLLMSSVYVLMALRDFVVAFYEEKQRFPTTRERLTQKRQTMSRLLDDKEIVQFWEKYKAAFNENRIRLWDALLEGLKKYHEVLKDRKLLCEEVVALRKQNQDLKRLLANYTDHSALMEPPCAIDRDAFLFKQSSYRKEKK